MIIIWSIYRRGHVCWKDTNAVAVTIELNSIEYSWGLRPLLRAKTAGNRLALLQLQFRQLLNSVNIFLRKQLERWFVDVLGVKVGLWSAFFERMCVLILKISNCRWQWKTAKTTSPRFRASAAFGRQTRVFDRANWREEQLAVGKESGRFSPSFEWRLRSLQIQHCQDYLWMVIVAFIEWLVFNRFFKIIFV